MHWLREVGGVGKKIGTSEGGKGGGGWDGLWRMLVPRRCEKVIIHDSKAYLYFAKSLLR